MSRRKRGLLATALVLLAGCVTLERPYPDIRYYALEISAPERSSSDQAIAIPAVLQVMPLRIPPRYDSRSFVYRTSDVSFETDFYHQFMAPPAALITDAVRDTLDRAHVFKNVAAPGSSQPPDYVLEGTIHSLYGDFRNSNAGQAVIDIEFLLRREIAPDPGIVLQKRYTRSVPLKSRSSEELVKSWNHALAEIVTELIEDLKRVGGSSTQKAENWLHNFSIFGG